jgi:very-short-patch-repair endonuclease
MPRKNLVIGQKVNPAKVARAKELRDTMTPAERYLWQQVRANRLDGWHFRRQQIIDGFIVDFYCHQANLVIEIDGPIHESQQAADAEREAILTRTGLKVLRFTNREVMGNVRLVLNQIRAALPKERPTPQPPSCEEGGANWEGDGDDE